MQMPQLLLPTLQENERVELLKIFDEGGGSKQALTKGLGGSKAYIMDLSDSYMKLHLDDYTLLELKLLPRWWRKPILALTLTHLRDPKLSALAFYDKDWNRIERERLFTYPDPMLFLKDSKDSTTLVVKNALMERGVMSYAISFTPDSNDLRLYLTTFQAPTLNKLHSEASLLFREDPIIYRWRKGKFVLKNEDKR